MTKNKILTCILAGCTLAFMAGCIGTSSAISGSASGTDVSSVPAYDSIDDLPASLSEVVASGSAALKKNRSLSVEDEETGMTLGSTAASNFGQSTSMAACETINMTKQAVNMAGEGDKTLCYIQAVFGQMEANGTMPEGLDVYDGQPHIFDMVFGEGGPEGGGGPSKVRMVITKDDAGLITSFDMRACNNTSQEMYLSQSIDTETGQFAMSSKNDYSGSFQDQTFEASNAVVVGGYVNGAGKFEGTKAITMSFDRDWSWGQDTGGEEGAVAFNWMADEGNIAAWMTGTNQFADQGFTFTNRAYSAFQLIDNNTDDANWNAAYLAIGSGATKVNVSGGVTSGCLSAFDDPDSTNDFCSWSDEFTESFDADAQVEDSNDYTALATAGTLPTVSDISISFSTAEAFDCTQAAAGTINMAEIFGNPQTAETAFAACEQLDHRWIDCWHVAGDGYDPEAEQYEDDYGMEGDGGGDSGVDYGELCADADECLPECGCCTVLADCTEAPYYEFMTPEEKAAMTCEIEDGAEFGYCAVPLPE
ncbi:MAG: hypothetical protein HQM16_03540 [Deltaproteobacteria bacterium]|nr:hypothetical protein [Deltaproteobacteria bacterium]